MTAQLPPLDTFLNEGLEPPVNFIGLDHPILDAMGGTTLPDEVAGLVAETFWVDYNEDGIVALSYSFNDTETFGLLSLRDEDQDRVRSLLDEIGRLTRLNFQEVEQDGAIDFSLSRLLPNSVGLARFPAGDDSFARFELSRPILEATLIQETLHALGLQGPEESFLLFDDLLFPDTFQTPIWSNLQTTALSFTDTDSTGLLALDIEGLIAVYGDSGATSGNDTYVFDTAEFYLEGLHDSGGTDWIEIRDADAVGVAIDLSGERAALDVGSDVITRAAQPFRIEPGNDSLTISETVNATRQTVIENVRAGGGDDRLTGNAAANRLIGNNGDDLIDGGAGTDTVSGGAGRDTLIGGAGRDSFFAGGNDDLLIGDFAGADASANSDADQLFGGGGNDLVITGSFDDLNGDGAANGDEVIADTAQNIAYGGAGSDTLHGGDGAETLGGGLGDDVIAARGGDDLIFGGRDTGADFVRADAGNDTVFASSGADSLWGGMGDDQLFGGAGNDLIAGGAGHDDIFGGTGNDTLTGGAGADSFFFAGAHGHDRITDFNADTDTLFLANARAAFTDLADLAAASTDSDAGLLIDTGDGTVLIDGLSVIDLARIDVVI